ncbi:putative 40S ribosomal protein S3 [Gregarina niphandrodes]|uniref:Small ribosomal subunit protein uS3 n=1 Tax=Gregarina niphandrodes TaxID=110365 RepID=A0A023B7I0_GRENI|nr:putative 40S ribosomal protein S3 [Gregarina niphandrodes]EZG67375.1 putative 40S ribosomal protein S3 [Gregarina niphandrodes]|eukprot:XP_011130256.1 putative 40S ribosomal protein S3 [Gregarina niphandrodes]
MTDCQISKKKKVVADGVFRAEVHEFLSKMLREKGFAGVEVRMTPVKTYVLIRTTRPRDVLGDSGRSLRELASLVQKRFGFRPNQVELVTVRVESRGLSAMAQAESLRFKLLQGMPPRRACYAVLRTVMESDAKGCEVTVAGKLRAQRAKTMKFKDGYMISRGHPANLYIEQAIRTVAMRQGILGVRVKIMLPHDPKGINGPKTPLPDTVLVHDPKNVQDSLTIKPYVKTYKPAAPVPVVETAAQPEQPAAVEA